MITKQFSVTVLVAATILSGCAASSKTFYASPDKIKGTQLCRTYFEASQIYDAKFASDLANKAQRRGLTYEQCQSKVAEDGVLLATALVATAVGVGIAARIAAVVEATADRGQ